jgi:hypothetical protein
MCRIAGAIDTVDFKQLIEMMVDANLANEKRNPGPIEG